MRIRPPEAGEAYACESCGKEIIHLNNRPPGTRFEFEAREIIDAGFLELVRYGVRRADDPLMVDSLKVVDAVLKRGLPQGPGWLRYNWDGYGDKLDGGPFQGWGKGHVWPLLTGERAHYELAAGNDITELIRTYEGFSTAGQMMPEQVWDEPNLPGTELKLGHPGGSAVPLVWAHAEYLKLLRSALDGKVFDRIDPVYERYSEPAGRERRRTDLEIYTRSRPIQQMAPGETLRIMDDKRFELVWTADDWHTTHTTTGRTLGCAGYSVDIKPPAESSKLQWTLHWPEPDSWLGYNVEVRVEAKE
jgi:glucoamylase